MWTVHHAPGTINIYLPSRSDQFVYQGVNREKWTGILWWPFQPFVSGATYTATTQSPPKCWLRIPPLCQSQFRIGAATTAAAASLPAWLIKDMGRWSSDAYQTYIRCPTSVLQSIPQLLAQTDAAQQPPWYPHSN